MSFGRRQGNALRRVEVSWLVVMVAGVLIVAPVDRVSAGHKSPISWSTSLPATATSGVSTNWSWYLMDGHEGAFTDVRGDWFEPSITCSSSLSPKNDDSFWIGIDGGNDSAVEQTGTEGICKGSKTTYDAWYEVFPKASVADFSISAGDQISAEVAWLGGVKYSITLTDETSGRSFHKVLTAPKAKRSSAEWITETSAECTDCLENFGTVEFTDSSVTKAGITGDIATWPNQRITMVAPGKTKIVMAQPSSLGDGGTSFTVTWKSSGGS